MIFLIDADNRSLFGADVLEMHRQRKAVFVDRLGWKVPVVSDMEIDDYDREDTMYLLAKPQRGGAVQASVRLLPTTHPHLMSELFAGACSSAVPRGPTIWEASRFCTTPKLKDRSTRVGLLWEIICGVMETALLFGVDEITFVASSALLPLALHCGWEARILGPTMRDGDDEITAVAASITVEGLRRVRRRLGISAPVTRFHAPTLPRGSRPLRRHLAPRRNADQAIALPTRRVASAVGIAR